MAISKCELPHPWADTRHCFWNFSWIFGMVQLVRLIAYLLKYPIHGLSSPNCPYDVDRDRCQPISLYALNASRLYLTI